jgi:hypothetical protein
MDKQATVMLSWVPPGKGGRKVFPPGPTYSSVVRFDEDKDWPTKPWSLCVEFIRSYASGKYVYARVKFLLPDAPHELLHEGSRFQLYEGRKLVATGLIRAGDSVPNESLEFEQALLH